MKLSLALAVAKQQLNSTHPSTIENKRVCPGLVIALCNNGQYITTINKDNKNIKKYWTFEEFVMKFNNKN